MLKHFFSLKFFKELKILFILESLMLIFGYGLLNSPSVRSFMIENQISYFNLFAALITLFIWTLSCVIDPKKYFNLATFVATGFFSYGVFWFMFELLMRLP